MHPVSIFRVGLMIAFVGGVLGPTPACAADPAANACSAAKIKAAGLKAKVALVCHGKAAKQGTTADPDCLANAQAKLDSGFARAESAGGCLTTGDDAAVSAQIDQLVSDVVAALPFGADPASRACAGTKRKAAGKKMKGLAKCVATGAKSDQAADPGCTATVEQKFDGIYANAESRGGCATVGDAAAIEAMINAALADATTSLVAVCGDGIAGPGEPCDGADNPSCVGSCLATCQCGGVCGNGTAESPGEECDDGDTTPGDGCDASCQLEDLSALCAGVPSVAGTTISSEIVISGLDNPVHLTAPALDPSRLFIVEQPGVIRIIKDGSLLPEPFLDIADRVNFGGERGLLGIAFHPDYESNGRFFVNYTRVPDGDTVIGRYQVTGDPDVADPDSEIILLVIDDFASNHNGGQVAFDLAGLLYVGNGDGGGGGDPQENGQDDSELLAKMLRIDVDVEVPPYYAVPLDNPNPGAGDPLGLIWAKGLRNPWRFSFDRANGDLYIGDVGQNQIEELDYQPGSSTGGENYGWDIFEGNDCYNDPEDGLNCPDPPTGFTFPVHEYTHGEGCSVTGGFVYRGCAMPDLGGTYFYADFCTAFVRTFEVSAGTAVNHADVTAAFGGINSISSFGEDARGELYVIDLGGTIRRVIPD